MVVFPNRSCRKGLGSCDCMVLCKTCCYVRYCMLMINSRMEKDQTLPPPPPLTPKIISERGGGEHARIQKTSLGGGWLRESYIREFYYVNSKYLIPLLDPRAHGQNTSDCVYRKILQYIYTCSM